MEITIYEFKAEAHGGLVEGTLVIFGAFCWHFLLRTGVSGALRRRYIIWGGGNGECRSPSARPREEPTPLLLSLGVFYAAVFVLASATH